MITLVLFIIALLLLAVFYLRIPVGMLLALLGFIGYALAESMNYHAGIGLKNALSMVGNEFWGTFANINLTVIPLFVLMGQIVFFSGLCQRLYESVFCWVGHKTGGIATATLLACGAFSAICGSNTATAATMSVVAYPQMKKYGYQPAFAGGVVATGSCLGAVIPPSVVAIVLSIQTGQPASQLFVGGILPGAILLCLLTGTVHVLIKRHPGWAPARAEAADKKTRLATLPGLLEAALLFGLVIGGLSGGIFTPTEAGAAGSMLALALGLLGRNLSIKKMAHALKDTMYVSAMIFLLLAGANIFGKFMVITRTPFAVAQSISSMDIAPALVMLLILAIFFVGGMIMDALALLLITLPIFSPLITGLGFNPLWFCLMLLVITTAGAITPPVGTSAFVASSMCRVPLRDIFAKTILFIPAFGLCLIIMALLPGLFLWLPGLAQQAALP